MATGVRVGELKGAVWGSALPDEAKPRKARLDELRALAEADGVKLGVIDTDASTWRLGVAASRLASPTDTGWSGMVAVTQALGKR